MPSPAMAKNGGRIGSGVSGVESPVKNGQPTSTTTPSARQPNPGTTMNSVPKRTATTTNSSTQPLTSILTSTSTSEPIQPTSTSSTSPSGSACNLSDFAEIVSTRAAAENVHVNGISAQGVQRVGTVNGHDGPDAGGDSDDPMDVAKSEQVEEEDDGEYLPEGEVHPPIQTPSNPDSTSSFNQQPHPSHHQNLGLAFLESVDDGSQPIGGSNPNDPTTLTSPTRAHSTSTSATSTTGPNTNTNSGSNREGFGTPRHSALDALAIAAAGVVPGSGSGSGSGSSSGGKTRKASASLNAVMGGDGQGPSGKKRRVNDGSAVGVGNGGDGQEVGEGLGLAIAGQDGSGGGEQVQGQGQQQQHQQLLPSILPTTLMWGDSPLDPSLAPGTWANGLLNGTRESSMRELGALGFESEAFDPALRGDEDQRVGVDGDEGGEGSRGKGKGSAFSGMNGQVSTSGGFGGGQGQGQGMTNAYNTSPVSNVSNISHAAPSSGAPTTNGNPPANSHRSFKTSTPIIPGRPDNPPPPGHVRAHSLNQYQLQQTAMAGPSSSQNSSTSARSGSKNNKHRAVGSKTIYTNQANVSATDPNVKYYKPNFTYHELITHEIKRSPEGRLQLSEIYKRISERYPYFKLGEPGWQNSIRHNLSLKKCFVRVDRPNDFVVDKSGKGGWWTYTPGTTEDGRPAGRKGATGKGTGEYRKGSTPSDIASRSPSPQRTIDAEGDAEHAADAAQSTSQLLESASMSLAQMAENPSEGMFEYGANATDISEMARLVQDQQQVDHAQQGGGAGQEMPAFGDQPGFAFPQTFPFDPYAEAFPGGQQ